MNLDRFQQLLLSKLITYPILLSQLVWPDLVHSRWPRAITKQTISKVLAVWKYKTRRVWRIVIENKCTSIIVPLVITPRELYIGPLGFFFTPMISRLKEHLSSGWVTLALVKRNPDGRMKRSYFGGFLVNPAPTNVAFVIILFHCLAAKEKNCYAWLPIKLLEFNIATCCYWNIKSFFIHKANLQRCPRDKRRDRFTQNNSQPN